MSGPPATAADDDCATGLPGLATWRSVYVLVSAIVFVWLVLLAILTRFYS
jgi:hypothetical protein